MARDPLREERATSKSIFGGQDAVTINAFCKSGIRGWKGIGKGGEEGGLCCRVSRAEGKEAVGRVGGEIRARIGEGVSDCTGRGEGDGVGGG